jgi:hypothetical protein
MRHDPILPDRMAEILDRIGEDARRLKVGQRLPQADPIPWEIIARVREDFDFMLGQPGLTMEMIGKALGPGYSRGSLSRFRNCTSREDYGPSIDKATRAINEFLELIARRRSSKLPSGFVETDVAKRMLVVIGKTIELASIGLIYADAGRGKSMTLKAASTIYPGSILVRVRQHSRTPTGIIKALAEATNIKAASVSGYRASSRLIDALSGSGRCLLIDEAHQLKHEALETIRDIHDETGCPIILAGTAALNEAVSDHAAFFGQMSSRIALRYNVSEDLASMGPGGGGRPLHSVDEIRELFERDRIRLTDDGRMLLTKIANLPGLGGLRLCAKLVQVAASASKGEPVTAELLLRVLRSMNDRGFAVHTVEQAIHASTSKVRIA